VTHAEASRAAGSFSRRLALRGRPQQAGGRAPVSTLLQLIRIEYCLLGALGVVTGALVNGLQRPTMELVATVLAIFFVAAGCYAFDDYFDVNADLANGRRDRPLVAGLRDRQSVLVAGAVALALAASAALAAGPVVLTIVAGGSVAALAYNRWLQQAYPVKNLLLAGAFPVPLIVGGLASSNPVSPALAWCCAVAYVVGLGFEVMIDIADVDGDRASGVDTLSTRLGTGTASRTAAAGFDLAAVLMLLPFALRIDARLYLDLPYLLLATASAAGAVHIGRSILRSQAPAHVFSLKRRAYVVLLLGLAAFPAGVLW